MVKVRETAWKRKVTYEEARRLCIDLFSPSDWLAQSLIVWRKNRDQGAKPGSQWLATILQYRALCDNMTPGQEPAFSDAFFALLLRAGVSEKRPCAFCLLSTLTSHISSRAKACKVQTSSFWANMKFCYPD
jgi:hypothetical protein